MKAKKTLLSPPLKGASSNRFGLLVIQDKVIEFWILPTKHICRSLGCGNVHYVATVIFRKVDFLAGVFRHLFVRGTNTVGSNVQF